MHVAIAVGTLLLGGWVVNPTTTDESANEPAAAAPTSSLPAPAGVIPPTAPPGVVPGAGLPQRGRGEYGGAVRPGMYGHPLTNRQPTRPVVPATTSTMPLAPTDFVPPTLEGAMGLPAVPTSNTPTNPARGDGTEMGTTALDRLHAPLTPTEPRRSTTSDYRQQTRSMPDTNRLAPPANNIGSVLPPIATQQQPQNNEKAFSNYRAPATTSPYMNLFRTGNDLGTIDNYNTLVRPQLEQQYLNRQFGNDIHGLRQDPRLQRPGMPQQNGLQGVSTPQYMNYGGYYNNAPAQGTGLYGQ